jgi:hypothetical protein
MSLVRSSTKWSSQKEKRRGRRRSSPASPSVGVEARGISPVAAETKGGVASVLIEAGSRWGWSRL